MIILLILTFSILYLLLAIKRLDWAIMILIATLPSYLIRFSIFSAPFTLLEAMILIVFAVWFLRNFKNITWSIKLKYNNLKPKIGNRKLIRYPFDKEIILLLIISFIAAAVSGFSDASLGIWKAYFFEPVLLFIVIINVFGGNTRKNADCNADPRGNSKLNFLVRPLAVSAFAVSIFAIYQKFTGAFIFNPLWAAEETRRITSFFGYPNAVGLYLGPAVLVLVGWLVNQAMSVKEKVVSCKIKVVSSVFTAIAIMASLLAIYFAKSEGALVGAAAGLVIFGLLAGRKARLATIAAIIVITAGVAAHQPTKDYAINKLTLRDLSGEIRRQQWRETWEMLKDGKLITGAGLANYQEAIRPHHKEGIFFNFNNDPDFKRKIVIFDEKYKSKYWQPVEIYLYPHNIFLNFWTELGIAGMLLFVWIISKYIFMGIKNLAPPLASSGVGIENKFLILGLLCAMVVIIVHGMVDAPYFKNDLAVMFWVLIAFMSIAELEKYNANLKS